MLVFLFLFLIIKEIRGKDIDSILVFINEIRGKDTDRMLVFIRVPRQRH